MADGSARRLTIARETIPNTINSPNPMQTLRVLPGSGLSDNRTSLQSGEITDSRQVTSSSLGNSNAEITIPVEVSYGSHDMLFEGFLGTDWIGGFKTSQTVDVSTAGVFTLSTGTWEALDVTVDSYVVVSGLAASADNGGYKVSAVSGATMTVQDLQDQAVTTTSESGASASFWFGAYAQRIPTSVSNTVTVSSTNKTMTLAGANTWSFNLEPADRIFISGFTNSGNNGWHKVTKKTDTVLTLEESTLTNETVNTTSAIEYVSGTGTVKTGKDVGSFTVEEGFTDISLYHNTTGAKINTMNMSFQPESLITGDFALQGVSYNSMTNTSIASSVTPASITNVFSSFRGYLTAGNLGTCVISGIDISGNNNLDKQFAILNKDACRIGNGRSIWTASLSGFFTDSEIFDKFANEEVFKISMAITDNEDNSYGFVFPRAKINTATLDVPENSITFSAGVDLLGGDEHGRTNITIHRTPKV